MADIRSYRKEKEKREQSRHNYKEKILRHKLKNVYRVLLVAVALIAVVVLVMVQYKRHIYVSYDTVATELLEASSGAEDVRLNNSVLTYSKDGAHCTNIKGEVTWNQTYEIQDILVDICQNVVAIGSYNGREIYVMDSDKQLGSITTNMPIRDIAVSATGNVTAVLSDTNVTYINTYSATGEMLFKGEAYMKEAGYPISISLSPNGMLLAVSYVYLDAGVLKSNVVFYNFGPVGDGKSDHMVSFYICSDTLVPEIRFMDNETAFAVGDNCLKIFKGSQTPTEVSGYMFDQEIQSVFCGNKYIGLVFAADDMEHRYMLDIYNTDGKKVDRYYFDLEYSEIFFEEECFVIYNATECQIFTYGGVEKFNGNFSKAADIMFPAGGAYKYILVTETSIDTIQLK
ncbi:MAG: DUF5711 family protein [Acetatifactor muris]|nr:DUF5711 family protein [Acetatifactor muris]MCM1528332.1 DUF5711 family protein [Bacteroides sp.]